MKAREPLLRIRNLTVRIDGTPILEDVSLAVEYGSIVSLVGPNGAGKSTILNAMGGLVPATGSIRFQGRELLGMSAREHRGLAIARTGQGIQAFDRTTLLEAVARGDGPPLPGSALVQMLGRPPWRGRRLGANGAVCALDRFGLRQFAHRPVRDLPFGIQKLAGVARALAREPVLVLLDEPASGLSDGEAATLLTALDHHGGDHAPAMLLVEHNMMLVRALSDHVVALDEGRVLAQGTPAQMASDPAVLRVYGMQAAALLIDTPARVSPSGGYG